jgi:hypothetical protein
VTDTTAPVASTVAEVARPVAAAVAPVTGTAAEVARPVVAAVAPVSGVVAPVGDVVAAVASPAGGVVGAAVAPVSTLGVRQDVVAVARPAGDVLAGVAEPRAAGPASMLAAPVVAAPAPSALAPVSALLRPASGVPVAPRRVDAPVHLLPVSPVLLVSAPARWSLPPSGAPPAADAASVSLAAPSAHALGHGVSRGGADVVSSFSPAGGASVSAGAGSGGFSPALFAVLCVALAALAQAARVLPSVLVRARSVSLVLLVERPD